MLVVGRGLNAIVRVLSHFWRDTELRNVQWHPDDQPQLQVSTQIDASGVEREHYSNYFILDISLVVFTCYLLAPITIITIMFPA